MAQDIKSVTIKDVYDEITVIKHILTGNGDPRNGLVFKVEQNTDAIGRISLNCNNIQALKERDRMQKYELDAIKKIREAKESHPEMSQQQQFVIAEKRLKIQELKDKIILWGIRLAVFYIAGETAYKQLFK